MALEKKARAAEGYVERGWSVLPCRWIADGSCACPKGADCTTPGKHPLTPSGVKDATRDRAAVEGWWNQWPRANVAVATGAPSGVWVLDVDPDHGGDASLAALQEQHGALPATLTARTGGDGRHLYFQHEENLPNRAGVLGDGLDVRSKGGYALAPPSNHASGGRYAWANDADVASAPAWLTALAKGRQEQTAAATDGKIVPEGRRDNWLTSEAGKLRRVGFDEPVIATVLMDLNNQRCYPPLAEAEVRRIAKSVARYPEGPPPLTDYGNGLRLASRHGADLRYCYAWKKWLIWDRRRWKKDDTGEVYRRAKDTAVAIYDEAKAAAARGDDVQKAIAKWANNSQSRPRLEAMIKLAESELPVQPEDLDRDEMLLNLENGTLELRTLTLRDHRPEDLITKLAPVALDGEAECPTWLKFLDRVMDGDGDLIAFLRRAAGYALTGSTVEQCFFLLHGEGANGKSTFLETLQALLGGYARPVEFRTLLHRDRSDAVRNDLAVMFGLRLVTAVEEANPGSRLDEALIKQLTGGDTISARFLYAEFFDFRPTFKLLLAANNKPNIRGRDHAIWRRVRLVPFEVTIPAEEQDRRLPEKLRAELPGILNWAVAGLREWRERGLEPPEAVMAATQEYRAEMDILADFLRMCCHLQEDKDVPTGQLFRAYERWCEDNGERDVQKNTFGKLMGERGHKSKVVKRGARTLRVYPGVTLAAEPEREPF